MTQIDFYSLPDTDPEARIILTCRLLEKSLAKKHRVLIQVNDKDDAEQLSEKIWGFRPESFLAHGFLNEHPKNQIEIGWTNDHGSQSDILIQLSDEIPEFFSRFNRVIEITCNTPAIITPTRLHFRFYKERGYPLKHHKLNALL